MARKVFDPLIDGTMLKLAGKSDVDIAVVMKDAGVLEPRVLGPMDSAIAASVEAAASVRPKDPFFAAKERNERFFATQAEAKQKRAAVAAVVAESAPAPARVKASPFAGKSMEELDQLEGELQAERSAAWNARLELEEWTAAQEALVADYDATDEDEEWAVQLEALAAEDDDLGGEAA